MAIQFKVTISKGKVEYKRGQVFDLAVLTCGSVGRGPYTYNWSAIPGTQSTGRLRFIPSGNPSDDSETVTVITPISHLNEIDVRCRVTDADGPGVADILITEGDATK